MSYEAIELTITDGLAHIVMNEPDRGNPIDEVFAADFRRAAEYCAGTREVRSVLLSAKGKYFSVRGDLKRLARDRSALSRLESGMLTDLVAGITTLAEADAPVIASVHGIAAGGTVGLIAGCDLVYAAPEASFVSAFSTIGLCTDSGSSYFVPRKVGLARAKEFFLLGESWSSEKAWQNGLVNKIVPAADLAATARMLP